MKKMSNSFILLSVVVLFIFGYFQGVVVPKTEQKYSQTASVIGSLKVPGANPKIGGGPCNPQVTKCGTIRIKKNTIPDSYQDFTFAHNIPGFPSTFILDDDGTLLNPSLVLNTISLTTPYSGLFTITETASPEFDTSVSCTNANTGAVQTVSSNSISINQMYGHTYSCVFTNKSNGQTPPVTACNPQITKCGVIKIRKNTIPDDYQDFSFNHNVPGYESPFVLDDDASLSNPSTLSNSIVLYTPANGVFNISEDPYDGYNTSVTCSNQQVGTIVNLGNSVNVPITNASNVSCLFTNELVEPPVASCTPNTWTQKADIGNLGISQAVGFSIGNKGYVGTGNFGSSSFWEYNPTTNIWTQKADFGGGGVAYATGFSIGNKGYVGTGIYANSTVGSYFWEYNPTTNIWTQKTDFPGTARDLAVGFSIGNKGYLGTGHTFNNSGHVNFQDFWEYNPANDIWTQKADFGGEARGASVGFSINGKGYIGTGRHFTNGLGYFFQDFWEYNPANDTWTQKADFGGGSRAYATGFSIGSKGYLGTGRIGVDPPYISMQDFWEYNPANDTWTQKANVGSISRREARGFSISGKGYIGAGYIGYTSSNDFYEYCP